MSDTVRVIVHLPDAVEDFSPVPCPRISWRIAAAPTQWQPMRAEMVIERDATREVFPLHADCGVAHGWPDEPLQPRETATLSVRLVDASGEVSEWSDPVTVTGGHLDAWPANFIDSGNEHPALLRGRFTLDASPVRATLYVSAFGAVAPRLNGSAIGDHEFAPGWTSYQWRVHHDVHDVTGAVTAGENVLGLELHGAWFTERFGFRDAAARFYQGPPSASAVLIVESADDSIRTVVTDGTWRWSRGGSRTSSLYKGEYFDARDILNGWDAIGFNDSNWCPVNARPATFSPTPRTAPPVRVTDTLAPIAFHQAASGAIILDFGQNIVGRLRLRTDAPAGTRITLRHAEVLQNGELATQPLRNATSTDVFIAAGDVRDWAPTGSFHGFRYAEVDGWPGMPGDGDIVAEVLGTDLPRIGGFHTSHPLLQRLHDNVVWGARGNFLSIPTDCPQRDERLGWTGDVQVFAPAATFLFECDGFLRSWLADVRREQAAADGIVPMVVPSVIPQVPGLFEPIAGWGDAITIVPHALRESTGNDEVLQDNLEAMIAWVEAIRQRTGGALLWEDGRQFGDWLDPDAPPDQPGRAKTDPDIIATAYYAHSARLTAEAAALVGRHETADHYFGLAENIRHAFCDTYITPRGRMMSDTPAAYALAIAFDLVDDTYRQALGDRLCELVRRRAYRIATGFAATPVICDALADTGHPDAAIKMMLQTENPSWLYPVTMGATTVWERWDSMLEDGTLNPGQMTSFNHFALGAVADWMHRALGGLTRTAPGMRTARFDPVFGEGINDAHVWHDSPYGRIEAGWQREGRRIQTRLVVPHGVRVEVALPGVSTSVGPGEHCWEIVAPTPAPSSSTPSLDVPMTDVLDMPAAYAALMEELHAWDPERAARLRRSLVWTPGRTLRDPLDKVPVEVMTRIAARFAAL